MTATNEQIKAEAERRRLKQYKAYGGRLPDVGGSLIDHVIEVTREGWKPPEPVDPDVLAYREWEVGKPATRDFREEVLAGKWDRSASATGFLAGARMAREQEKERAKALEGLLREIEPYSNFIPWFDLQNRFDALLKEPTP